MHLVPESPPKGSGKTPLAANFVCKPDSDNPQGVFIETTASFAAVRYSIINCS